MVAQGTVMEPTTDSAPRDRASDRRFVSVILYTCVEFDDGQAVETTREFFELTEWDTATF